MPFLSVMSPQASSNLTAPFQVPTVGAVVSFPLQLGGGASVAHVIVLFDNVGGVASRNVTIVSLAETAVVVRLPPGDGVGHTLQVRW